MTATELVQRLPELQRAAGIQIDVDATALVVAVLFLGLMVILKGMLFDPYLKLVEEREKRTAGATTDAADMTAQTAALQAEYDKRIAAARTEAAAIRDEIREEARVREESILSEARQRASEITSAASKATATELSVARSQMEARAEELSRAIASRILPQA
jgi:F-type H+-transporting ATPase subunit b